MLEKTLLTVSEFDEIDAPFPSTMASPVSPTPPEAHFESLNVIEKIKTELHAPNAAPYLLLYVH